MESPTTKLALPHLGTETNAQLFEDWFDPIESGVRGRIRDFIESMIEAELEEALSRPRYGRRADAGEVPSERPEGMSGHRHGHRSRSLMGTFGPVQISVPRARLNTPSGKTSEWKSRVLPVYQRRTKTADALIAGAYLSGTNTRRVRRALATLFRGAVSKDTVSRVWRKVESDWKAWNARSLTNEPIVRLILDGTVVRVRLDRKATSISLLVVLGVRADGQKVLLVVRREGRRISGGREGAPPGRGAAGRGRARRGAAVGRRHPRRAALRQVHRLGIAGWRASRVCAASRIGALAAPKPA